MINHFILYERRYLIPLLRKITKRQWTLILLFILFVLFIYFILPISVPLIVAFFTALALNPVVRLIQYKVRLNRKSSVIIVFLLFILIIVILGIFVVTKAVTILVHFFKFVPRYFNMLNKIA